MMNFEVEYNKAISVIKILSTLASKLIDDLRAEIELRPVTDPERQTKLDRLEFMKLHMMAGDIEMGFRPREGE